MEDSGCRVAVSGGIYQGDQREASYNNNNAGRDKAMYVNGLIWTSESGTQNAIVT